MRVHVREKKREIVKVDRQGQGNFVAARLQHQGRRRVHLAPTTTAGQPPGWRTFVLDEDVGSTGGLSGEGGGWGAATGWGG